jgi:hypothetical protein
MLVDPPLEHHEAPAHWIPLDRIFVAIPEVRTAFHAELVSQIRHRFGDDIEPSVRVDAGRWLIRFGRWNIPLGELPHYSGTTPLPPPYFEEREHRDEVSEAVRIARSNGYGRLRLLIGAGAYRVHARFGAADADFRHIPRDVWLGSWPGDSWRIVTTEAGTALFVPHVERMAIVTEAARRPDEQFKVWLRGLINASRYERTIKLSDDPSSDLACKAAECRISRKRAKQLKNEVLSEFDADPAVRMAWQKSGRPPSRN